ncbi:MAG: hypothetical protein NT121_19805 [Chloroflexi bacterium]|nr:hypothetical protein [Chloroflexota bacterium]
MADQIVQIGLIVTGKGEHEFLPAIFQSLGRTGTANFRTIGRTGQRSPITSKKRLLRMVGDKKIIPTEDEKQIGLPARFFLQTSEHCCVMVIDDLESAQIETAQPKFDRYRLAVDTMLKAFPGMKERASVHFLANMLEAYYFADAWAINQHLLFPVATQRLPR